MEEAAAKADEKRFTSKQVAAGEIFYCINYWNYLGIEKKKKCMGKEKVKR